MFQEACVYFLCVDADVSGTWGVVGTKASVVIRGVRQDLIRGFLVEAFVLLDFNTSLYTCDNYVGFLRDRMLDGYYEITVQYVSPCSIDHT